MVALIDAADGQDEVFNEWYGEHIREIFEVPGVVSARRYRRAEAQAPGATPVDREYLAIYELDGPPEEILAELVRRRADNEWKPRRGMDEASIRMWCFEPIDERGRRVGEQP